MAHGSDYPRRPPESLDPRVGPAVLLLLGSTAIVAVAPDLVEALVEGRGAQGRSASFGWAAAAVLVIRHAGRLLRHGTNGQTSQTGRWAGRAVLWAGVALAGVSLPPLVLGTSTAAAPVAGVAMAELAGWWLTRTE